VEEEGEVEEEEEKGQTISGRRGDGGEGGRGRDAQYVMGDFGKVVMIVE
jgi:hypothetical protein